MTDLLRIAHPQNCPPYGNSRVGICEIHLKITMITRITVITRITMITKITRITNIMKRFFCLKSELPGLPGLP